MERLIPGLRRASRLHGLVRALRPASRLHCLLRALRPASRAKCLVLALSMASMWLCVCGGALADVKVRVAGTDPGRTAALGRDEPFYVEVEFTADEPISIWVRPFFGGKPVLHAKSNASSKHAGSGSAIGWFSLDDASEVDEVRIVVGGGKPYREWVGATYPVSLGGTGRPAATRERAGWVAELSQAEDVARRQAYEKQTSEPVSASDSLFMSGFMLAILALLAGGLAAPVRAVWRWRGGWRMAAGVPLALLGFVVLRIIVGTSIDPTSHNLWPFEILMWSVISLLLLGGIAFVRRITGGAG